MLGSALFSALLSKPLTSKQNMLRVGTAVELAADPQYGRGMIYGGRWFQDVKTRAIWRLVAPDSPFRGLWEPVIRACLN
jgi:hypothetical protein